MFLYFSLVMELARVQGLYAGWKLQRLRFLLEYLRIKRVRIT